MENGDRQGKSYGVIRNTLVICILLAVVACPLLVLSPVSADWGPVIKLVDVFSLFPAVAVSGDTVHVAFDALLAAQVHYKRSTDGGQTWGPDITLSDPSINSHGASIAVAGNTVHVVFDPILTTTNICYIRSLDGGQTWGPRTYLTSDNASILCKVAAWGSNVYLVWYSIAGSSSQKGIYFRRSIDDGQTWDNAVRLNIGTDTTTDPSIAVSGNLVHVVWGDATSGEVCYAKSSNGGQTWSVPAALTSVGNLSLFPAVAASSGAVNIIYLRIAGGTMEIRYLRSTDDGQTWTADTLLSNEAPGYPEPPAIATFGADIYTSWPSYSGSGSTGQISFRQSSDNGASWASEQILASGTEVGFWHGLAMAAYGSVYMLWGDIRTGSPSPYIFYMKFTGPPPSITSFTPLSGSGGSQVIITGINLLDATAVSFGGVPASSFTADSATQITATVGAGATGKISVTTLEGTATSMDNFIFILSLLGTTPHGSGSTVTTLQQGPVSLPNISVRSASLSAAKVAPGTPVTVTADVANSGNATGTARITLYINGQEETSRGVQVNSGGNTPVTFTVTRSEPGTYTVYVGGAQAGSFTVDWSTDSNTVLYISGALIIFALLLGLIYMVKRR